MKATDVDNYDRLVARVSINATDSSVYLLESGLACHFTRFANDPKLVGGAARCQIQRKGILGRARREKPRCVKFVDSPSRRSRP